MVAAMSAPKKNSTKVKPAKKADRDRVVTQHKGIRLLGEVVCWNTSGKSHPLHAVVAALKNNGLDDKVARAFMPQHAFTRAMKKLEDDRVIRAVNQDKDSIRFQFTRMLLEDKKGEKAWTFKTECFLELDKQTGKVSCPTSPDLETRAQELVDHALEARTSADITKMIQKLFEQQADLFPVRDQGGVYFVPDKFSEFTGKIETFLATLGGSLTRFPVPVGTAAGDRAVKDAVAHGIGRLIADLETAVDEFGTDTRPDTLKKHADRIAAARVKAEAYSSYLQDRVQELEELAESCQDKLKRKVEEISQERANSPVKSVAGGGSRAYVFGFAVTAVIRRLRLEHLSFRQIKHIVDKVLGEGKIAEPTIRTHMGCAVSGERGPAAGLTDEQKAELLALLDDMPTDTDDKGDE
jgi:hypothetical protein